MIILRRLISNARIILLTAILPAILLAWSGCSTARVSLKDISATGSDRYECTHKGVRHDFIIDFPEKVEGSPLVIMLPGAGGTAESFRLDTRFHETACTEGYTVVYVTGAPEPGDHTSPLAWNHEGRESGNDDTGFLKALVAFIHEVFHTDQERCFAAGFSNGAFMCHRLALEASDTFSAVISVAGTMSENTWKNKPDICTTSLLQIAGERDDVIPKLSDRSAGYSAYPAIEDLISYYASANGLDSMTVREIGRNSTLTEYYSKDSERLVWFLYVTDGRHSWSAERVTGINTNKLIIDFLESITNHSTHDISTSSITD